MINSKQWMEEFSKEFGQAIIDGLFLFIKEFWLYILVFFALATIARIVNTKSAIEAEKKKKQREQEEFERRVELYLKKKDEYEAKKKRT